MKTPLRTLAFLLMSVAAQVATAEVIFSTSFEGTDDPSYTIGRLLHHEGWVLNGSSYKSAALIIAGGDGETPAAPDGEQMLELKNPRTIFDLNEGGPFVSHRFSAKPMRKPFYFTGLTAFSGTLSAKTETICRFYLAGSDKKEAFLGPVFGIWKKNDHLRFFCSRGARGRMMSFGDAAIEAGRFYRFEVNVTPDTRSFQIKIYDHESNRLLAEADDGRYRNDISISVNYLRMSNSSNTPEFEDQFVTYYDGIRIGAGSHP